MIEYHLNKYINKFENFNPRILPSSDKNYALIVETRPNLIFINVIKNFLYFFPDFNLIIVGNQAVFDLASKYFKNFIKISLNINTFKMNIKTYNYILTDKNFWSQIPGENILIFQSDCVFFRSRDFNNFNKGMIGAVCVSRDDNTFVMNGGLSLRKKKLMIEICNFKKNTDEVIEDIFFTNFIRSHYPELMPTMQECMDFAIESYGNPNKAIGMHGTDKYYCDIDLIKAALLSAEKD